MKKLIAQDFSKPQEIINPIFVNIISNDYSNAAIDKDGFLYTWGIN
jgi:alpha-tubulin suppressor-like RCC1 family protein